MNVLRINDERIKVIGSKLGKLGLDIALKIEELDPQFQAAKLITQKMSFGPALTLIVLNSLISYRLSGRGEDYWSEFALYVSKMGEPRNLREAVKLMVNFLSNSRINVTLRRSKMMRLLKVSMSEALEPWNITKYTRNLRGLAKALASSLKTKWTTKTIIFAMKMLCYAYRAHHGKPLIAPFNIPIPIDSRIAKLSWTSGMLDIIDAKLTRWSDVVRAVTSKPSMVQRAWSNVAKTSGIPPLHLDSILWLIGGFISKRHSREEVIKAASNALSRITSKSNDEVSEVVKELINRYL